MNRYEDATQELNTVFNRVVEERFPIHCGTKFKLLFDTKKRMKQGKITLATIETTNDKTRFLTSTDLTPEGFDYIVIVDKLAWDTAQAEDRVRLLSHELCHAFIDEKGKYKILDHDIQDFLAEIKRNEDNPDWGVKLAALVSAMYEQKSDQESTNQWQAHS